MEKKKATKMSRMNDRILLVVAAFWIMYNLTLCAPVDSQCHTVCLEGTFCNVTVCVLCPAGYYQESRAHKEISCKPLTVKTDGGWILLYPGNFSKDNEWGCNNNSFIYNNSGTLECHEAGQQTTVESDLMTTDLEKSTGLITINTTTSLQNSPDVGVIVGVTLGCVFFVVFLIVLLFKFRKRLPCVSCGQNKSSGNGIDDSHNDNSIPNENDKMLDSNIIESSDLNLDDNGQHSCTPSVGTNYPNEKANNDNLSSDETELKKIPPAPSNNLCNNVNNNALHLSKIIKHALNTGQKSKHEITSPSSHDIELSDMKSKMDYADGKKKLTEAFEAMCIKLCEDLGTCDGDYIKNKLNCHSDVKGYVLNFTACLSKWSENFPENQLEDGLWFPLSKLKGFLKDRERNDILEKFDLLTEEVMHQINELNKNNDVPKCISSIKI